MADDRPLEVVFLGFALPEARFRGVLDSDPGMPVQTQRFGWAVIDALRSAGATVRALSTDPVTDYPNNRQLFFRGSAIREHATDIRIMPFVNLTVAKHVSRWSASLHHLHRMHRARRADVVMVHGVNSALLWAAIFFGFMRHVPVVVILTDPPSLRTAFDSWLTWQLKRVDRWTITSALAKASGVVALAPRLASDFAPGVPSLLMEGISPEPSGDAQQTSEEGAEAAEGPMDQRVTYAGGVSEKYGVLDLVEAASLSSGTWTLEIYGLGPDVATVEKTSRTNLRVRYGGLIDSNELAAVYSRADLLVNPRPVGGEVPLYSFPSKLLEYLASGTPVMTTALPTLPDDYAPHVTLAEEGAVGLARAIDTFFARPRSERMKQAVRAKQFIVTTRGRQAQGVRLADFLTTLRP